MPVVIPRPEVEASLLEAVESERSLILTGPRGSGKTALLERLKERFHGPVALAQVESMIGPPELAKTELERLAGPVLGPGAATRTLWTLPADRVPGSLLLLDDVTELRTLSYYPGVDKPLETFLDTLRSSIEATVATSRFGFWMRRQFPQWEFRSVPPISVDELRAAGVPDPDLVFAVTGGIAVHVSTLAEGRVVSTLADELRRGGTIEAECRATMAELLQRARGYGACKSVLRVLADEEALNLTAVARRIDRTPGSTRDYLRWLEEVDLIAARNKLFYFVDPVLRLWLRIHGRGVPATPRDVRREVEAHLSPRDIPTAAAFQFPPAPSEDLVEID